MCECERLGVDEQIERFDAVLEKYKNDRTNIMVVLQETQEIFGYIPEGSVKIMAESLKMPESEIFGIITFSMALPAKA